MKLCTKEDHNVEVCIIKGSLQGVTVPGLSFFFQKYLVFTTLSIPLRGILMKLKERKISMWRCAYKGSTFQLFLKELRPLTCLFFFFLSLHLLLNPLGDFDETWYQERSHYVDVHIVRVALSNFFKEFWPLDLAFSLKIPSFCNSSLTLLAHFYKT
jgi:hypothetical protein